MAAVQQRRHHRHRKQRRGVFQKVHHQKLQRAGEYDHAAQSGPQCVVADAPHQDSVSHPDREKTDQDRDTSFHHIENGLFHCLHRPLPGCFPYGRSFWQVL